MPKCWRKVSTTTAAHNPLRWGVWCAQCDKLVLPAEVAACRSDFCKAKDA